MWVKMPKEFGRVVKDLSPNESDQSKKSLFVIKFDDQQRNFNVPPQYYGIFWSADGPGPVNKVAISLWSRFDDYETEDHRDEEMNIDGAKTEPGKCYSGFACFGYGSIAISLDVEEVHTDNYNQVDRLYRNGMLERASKLVNRCPDNLDELMEQWRKSPSDENCRTRIHSIIGGAAPKFKLNGSS